MTFRSGIHQRSELHFVDVERYLGLAALKYQLMYGSPPQSAQDLIDIDLIVINKNNNKWKVDGLTGWITDRDNELSSYHFTYISCGNSEATEAQEPILAPHILPDAIANKYAMVIYERESNKIICSAINRGQVESIDEYLVTWMYGQLPEK